MSGAVVAACKAKLFGSLRDDYVKSASRGRVSNAEGAEWSRMDQGLKMAMLLLAGIDGDLSALSLRDWRELPEEERRALKAQIRHAKREFVAVAALSGRW